ncbi:MAG: hypothetical protein H0U42_00825 [Thermoleophilaceae bacterium]|nr:hypothetical protein [Thermoleophilaceae bacterium]
MAAAMIAALTLAACGSSGSIDTTGATADDYTPEQQEVIEAATNYRDAIVNGDPKAACQFTSADKRLELAKELDEAGSVSKLCIKSLGKEIKAQQKAAGGEFTIGGVKILGRTEAEVDLSVGDLTGTWFMALDNDGWRFDGGALGPASDASEDE